MSFYGIFPFSMTFDIFKEFHNFSSSGNQSSNSTPFPDCINPVYSNLSYHFQFVFINIHVLKSGIKEIDMRVQVRRLSIPIHVYD